MPLIRYFSTGPSPNAPTVWPTVKCCSVGRRLVDGDLPVALGPLPGHELERVEALVRGRCGDAEGDALVRASDRLAVGVDEPRMVLDRALRDAHAREALDLGRARRPRTRAPRRSPVLGPTAAFELMTASVALYDSLKMPSKLLPSVSVSTKAPLIIATPSTIANAGQRGAELASEQALEGDADHAARHLLERLEDLVGRRGAEVLHDQAVGEEEDAVGDGGRVRVVGDHHGRLAVARDRVAQQLQDLAARLRVEVARSARRRT